jgi:23S rRNA (uracil1939-C5)-methyltransferase
MRHVLSKINSDGKHSAPDVVFVDPPRSGLDPLATKILLEQNPPRIVYISCNPKIQAIDIEFFVQKGYRLVALQPVEQFPQVAHVENIALLVRDDACT